MLFTNRNHTLFSYNNLLKFIIHCFCLLQDGTGLTPMGAARTTQFQSTATSMIQMSSEHALTLSTSTHLSCHCVISANPTTKCAGSIISLSWCLTEQWVCFSNIPAFIHKIMHVWLSSSMHLIHTSSHRSQTWGPVWPTLRGRLAWVLQISCVSDLLSCSCMAIRWQLKLNLFKQKQCVPTSQWTSCARRQTSWHRQTTSLCSATSWMLRCLLVGMKSLAIPVRWEAHLSHLWLWHRHTHLHSYL